MLTNALGNAIKIQIERGKKILTIIMIIMIMVILSLPHLTSLVKDVKTMIHIKL